jgi:DNA (cytosine-5)-methyltransferase 1
MSNPTLADLFCCEGGAANGYTQAGFEVYGFDTEERKRKRYMLSGAVSFTVADATTVRLDQFDAVHASPPCEDHSATMGFGMADRGTGWLLPHTIKRLEEWHARTGKPYVIENVVSKATRALMPGAVMLCGSAFGLGAHDSSGQYRSLARHRLFLTSFPVSVPPCECAGRIIGGVYGNGEQGKNGGRGYGFAADAARQAMGMPWASRHGCAEAIPPAYTGYLGAAMRGNLR